MTQSEKGAAAADHLWDAALADDELSVQYIGGAVLKLLMLTAMLWGQGAAADIVRAVARAYKAANITTH